MMGFKVLFLFTALLSLYLTVSIIGILVTAFKASPLITILIIIALVFMVGKLFKSPDKE